MSIEIAIRLNTKKGPVAYANANINGEFEVADIKVWENTDKVTGVVSHSVQMPGSSNKGTTRNFYNASFKYYNPSSQKSLEANVLESYHNTVAANEKIAA